MIATVRALRPAEPTSAGPAADALREHSAAVGRLNAQFDDVRRRGADLEQLLRDDATARARVDELREQRRARVGEQVARGLKIEAGDLDRQIRDAEAIACDKARAIAALDGVGSVQAAVAYLNEQARRLATEANHLSQQLPALLHGAAIERLADLAPVYAKGIDDFLGIYLTVAAAARAADLLAPAARANQVASGVMMRLELTRPSHKAFDLIQPQDFGHEVHARAAALLRELGAPDR